MTPRPATLAVAILAALLLAVAAAACDGGGGGGADTPPPGDVTAASGPTVDNLKDLAGRSLEGVTAKVTYRVTTEALGEEIVGEWSLVQRPPEQRFEIADTEEGQTFRTIIISTPEQTYVCVGGDVDESCLAVSPEETEPQTGLFDPLFEVPRDIVAGTQDVASVEESRRVIAGAEATCFAIASSIPGLGDGEVCFAEDGLPLLLRGESGGRAFTFEATSVSTLVTDADFEPPFPVVELGDFDFPTQ